jgi:hypothetical protein
MIFTVQSNPISSATKVEMDQSTKIERVGEREIDHLWRERESQIGEMIEK